MEDCFKDELIDRFILLMSSERGIQAKLAKSINKPSSYFNSIKQRKPVNATHLKAVGNIFGYKKVCELLSIEEFEEERTDITTSQTTPPAVKNQIGIIEQFKDQESALEISQDLLYIETQSRETFEKAKNIIKGMKEAVSVKTDSAHSSNGKKNSGFWNGQERRQKKTG